VGRGRDVGHERLRGGRRIDVGAYALLEHEIAIANRRARDGTAARGVEDGGGRRREGAGEDRLEPGALDRTREPHARLGAALAAFYVDGHEELRLAHDALPREHDAAATDHDRAR